MQLVPYTGEQMEVETVSATLFRNKFTLWAKRIKDGTVGPIYVALRGKPALAVLSVEEYEALVASSSVEPDTKPEPTQGDDEWADKERAEAVNRIRSASEPCDFCNRADEDPRGTYTIPAFDGLGITLVAHADCGEGTFQAAVEAEAEAQ